ncbi:MAG: cupin [Symploca sp. SIO1B1]|nr:cupin [Symploca sp. SIO1B1]
MSLLSEILKPYKVEEFLKHHWTSQAIHIPSAGENKFGHLFSWEQLNYLLNFHQFQYPELRLALDGKVLDARENANLLKLCQQGATLIINGVHKLVPAIAQFTQELRYDLGYGTQINAYCSWPGRQGFSSHYDTHEVFILQVDGSKKWQVFQDTMKYPLPEQKSSVLVPPEGEPELSCILNPGDVLYIPRGYWHYALALEQPSLHLTLGIHCQTGIDFLEWLVSQLCQQEEWRKSLPLRTETAPVAAAIEQLMEKLDKHLTYHNIAEEYISYLDSLGKPAARYALPEQAGFNLFPQGSATQFTSAKSQRVNISELPEEDGYKIVTSGKEIVLRGVNLTMLENLFKGETFKGEDVLQWLSDCDWELDIVPLLSRLVMEGLIFIKN